MGRTGRPLPPEIVTCNVGAVPRRRPAASVVERVRGHRDRLRAQGLRPIQIWVPDVRSSAFIAQAHEQSHAVAVSASSSDDQAFIDAVSMDDE